MTRGHRPVLRVATDERIRVPQYLLLDQERALRERLAQLSAAYEEARTMSAPEATAE